METQDIYITELNAMLENAIKRMNEEHPNFIIYTASIWTDKDAKVSAISFDSKQNALQKIEKSNEWDRKKYEKFLAEGDLEQAELFKPEVSDRLYNPADFEWASFEECEHEEVPIKWYLMLKKIGKSAFEKIVQTANIDKEKFELGINSNSDWYDKSWSVNK